METSIEELKREIEQLRQEKTTLVDALKEMLDIYEELHARYDLGECQATVDAKAALVKVGKS